MKNFTKHAEGIEVEPLLAALAARPHLWDRYHLRTCTPGSPHSQVNDTWLRFQDYRSYLARQDIAGFINEHECVCFPAWFELAEARQIVFDVMRRMEGLRLGRVLITKLHAGGVITPHVDDDAHVAYYDRFHLALQGPVGSIFQCGDESVEMRTGELWSFDNAVEHSVRNESETDRIHLLIDIHTNAVPFE